MTLPERTFVVMMTDKRSLTIPAARIRVAIASVPMTVIFYDQQGNEIATAGNVTSVVPS